MLDARMLHSRIYEDANKVRIMNDQFSMFDSPADVESAAPKSAPNWMPNYARLYGLTRDELRYTPLVWIRKKFTTKISLGDIPRGERE